MTNETVADVVSYMVDFVDQVSDEITLIAVREYADRIQAAHAREVSRAVANERVRDVHTCHDQCERPLCAMTRRAEAAEADARRLDALIENEWRVEETIYGWRVERRFGAFGFGKTAREAIDAAIGDGDA